MEPLATSAKELAENTDIGFIQGCNWDKHLVYALPFIELEKSVFLDKPMVGSVKDVKRVRELIKNSAKIIGSSSARYATEIQEFLNITVEERGEVIAVYAESGVDEFNYGVHVGEIISDVFKIDSSKIYVELLKRVSDYLKTGESPVTDVEKVLNVTEFMLCGKKSRDEKNGAEVFITDLTDNDAFDGDAMERLQVSSSSV